MDVPMELSRIVISEHTGHQLIFLREQGGERTFPIVIGVAEAYAIRRRLNKTAVLRPMTHDLLANTIKAMGGGLEKIVINDIRKLDPADPSQTFIATLFIRRDGKLIEVDSRPSDALALGVGLDTPIFVAGHVLEAVTTGHVGPEDPVKLLRRAQEELAEGIEEVKGRLADEEFVSDAPAEVLEEYRRRLKEMQAQYDAIERVLNKLK